MDYEKAYKILFNAVTNFIENNKTTENLLRLDLQLDIEKLKKAQQRTENMYIDANEEFK